MNTVFMTLSASPMLAGRTFLTIFVFLGLARLSQSWEYLANTVGPLLASVPAWMTSNEALGVCAVLAAIEVFGDKNSEMRELMSIIEEQAKPLLAFAFTLGLLSAEDKGFLEPMLQQPAEASLGAVPVLLAALTAGLVWFFVHTKNAFLRPLREADSEDDSGVQGVTSWVTDLFSVTGILVYLLLPTLAFILLGITFGGFLLLRWYLHKREARKKIACGECGTEHWTSALYCPNCATENPAPKRLSVFGLCTSEEPVEDRQQHAYGLMHWRRCPACATHLPKKRISQECPECSRPTMADRQEAEQYFRHVQAQLPRILLVSAALSAVPVVGLVAGVIYYRLSLIAGMKQYVPTLHTLVGRWFVRIVCVLILIFQPVPLLGTVTVPIMCLINFWYFRSAFKHQLNGKLCETSEETKKLPGPSQPALAG